MTNHIFALTARGLEQISAAEMGRMAGVQVEQVAYRRVCASANNLDGLLALRTVDDVFLELAAWGEIVAQRSALARLKDLSAQLTLAPALAAAGPYLHLSSRPSFSVTANFVGKRNYNADEIKRAVSDGVVSRYRWEYGSEDVCAINLRVFIEHATAYVGLRLSPAPLHSRLYKQAHLSGSLKPNVAAAMLELAGVEAGMSLLDPFCGAGTIPIEAGLGGAQAWGGDVSAAALAAAAQNAAAAGIRMWLAHWDARRLPLASGSLERIVSNLPWGRQVVVDEEISRLYARACAEMERVLAPGGRIALLTNLTGLVGFERLRPAGETEISLFGQTPTIIIFA